MYRKIILLLVIATQAQAIYSQTIRSKTADKLELQLKPSVGVNIPLTKLLKGNVTDNLMRYDDNTGYWQVLAATLFFSKHWGIEFNYQGFFSGNRYKRKDGFRQAIQTTYANDNYITSSTSATYDTEDIFGGNLERGLLGAIYRIEYNKFYVYPKLAIGVTSFSTDWARIDLKEKGSNNVTEVYYTTGDLPKDHFTVAAATAAGYKINKWLYFNVDLLTSWYKTNFSYTKTTTDLNTKQSTLETTPYKKNMFGLSLGAGFIISFKNL